MSIFDIQNSQPHQMMMIGNTFRGNTVSNHTIAEESKESLEALPSIEKERHLQSNGNILANGSTKIIEDSY